MQRNRRFHPVIVLVILTLLPAAVPAARQKTYLERLAIAREQHDMTRLHKTKQGAHIRHFSSDGCSGGMSSSWHYLARKIPAFSKHFHKHPPWLDCCTRHDMAYWQGETENGFHKRLQADRELQRCVVQQGDRIAARISKKYGIPENKVKRYFRITARLMFHAVRAGGGPCTPFPWRWGYGWPKCK